MALVAIAGQLDRRSKMFQGGAPIAAPGLILDRLKQICQRRAQSRTLRSLFLDQPCQQVNIDRPSSPEVPASLAECIGKALLLGGHYRAPLSIANFLLPFRLFALDPRRHRPEVRLGPVAAL